MSYAKVAPACNGHWPLPPPPSTMLPIFKTSLSSSTYARSGPTCPWRKGTSFFVKSLLCTLPQSLTFSWFCLPSSYMSASLPPSLARPPWTTDSRLGSLGGWQRTLVYGRGPSDSQALSVDWLIAHMAQYGRVVQSTRGVNRSLWNFFDRVVHFTIIRIRLMLCFTASSISKTVPPPGWMALRLY
jgi:hypothetical protein